jgi:hypothetical protein
MIGVREQDERQLVFVPEQPQLFHWVGADAHDDRVQPGDLVGFVPESDGVLGSAAGHGLGVEIQDDALAAQVAQPDGTAVRVGQGEIRRLVSDADHGFPPFAWCMFAQ